MADWGRMAQWGIGAISNDKTSGSSKNVRDNQVSVDDRIQV